MDPDHIRLAVIGCGGIARGHGERLAALGCVEFAGLCEVSEASVAQFRERVEGLEKVPVFEDHHALLKAVEPDAVLIATPHTLHGEQIVASLEAGAHVLCEKPMVCTRAEARRVMEAEERADRRVMISYQRHVIGPYVYAKYVIHNHQFGDVRYVTCRLSQDWIKLTNQTPPPWRLDPKLSGGGQLMDSGSHMLDCMLWLTDLVAEEVFAYQDNVGLKVDVQTAATCRFTNGALGTIAVLGDSRGRGGATYDDINIYGELGELLLRNDAVFRRDGRADLYEVPREGFPNTVSPDQAFIELITGGRPENPAPSICGLRMAELAETIYRSAQLGRPVKVAELDD